MKHRTARGLTALTLTSALLLTACSGSDDKKDEPTADSTTTTHEVGGVLQACTSTPKPAAAKAETATTSEADAAVLAALTVEGELGAKPTLTITPPVEVAGEAVRVVDEGTGAEILDSDVVSYQLVAYSGSDGVLAQSTWETAAQEGPMSTLPPIIADAIVGKKVGARVLYAYPGTDSTGATMSAIFVLDVVGATPNTALDRAEGEAVTPAEGLPTITLDEAGVPTMSIAEGTKAPTELVTQPLIKGDGAVVASGDSVTFNYSGWTVDCEQFDSSWTNGAPFTTAIGTGAVIKGWDEGLVGQTVGSQVLLFIPRSLAYGESPSHALKDDDLIFLVDILAATPAA